MLNSSAIKKTGRIHHPAIGAELEGFFNAPGQEAVHILRSSLEIPKRVGSGYMLQLNPSDGLQVRLWNFQLNENQPKFKAEFAKTPSGWFRFVCFLTPDSFQLKKINQHQQLHIDGMRTELFTTSDIDLEFDVMPGMQVMVLCVKINCSRLMAGLNPSQAALADYITNTVQKKLRMITMKHCAGERLIMVQNQFSELQNSALESAEIEKGILGLVTGFLAHCVTEHVTLLKETAPVQREKMAQVETILNQHLHCTLPPLAEIALTVSLSESTLQRHFKQNFGKSLYEYYLVKKMLLADELLTEQLLSVNEVADKLGYENVSSFIDVFKKHRGISPGSLRRHPNS